MRLARWHVTPILAAITVLAACEGSGVESPGTLETPRKQFVAEVVTIEEYRDGELVWSGTADTADGDLESTDVTHVRLQRHPQRPKETPLTLAAPTAHLAFGEGFATFQDVRIQTADGAELVAKSGRYEEEEGRLDAEGPLAFSSAGLTARATRGVVYVDEGRVDLTGPVVGQWNPPASPLKRRQPPAPEPPRP